MQRYNWLRHLKPQRLVMFAIIGFSIWTISGMFDFSIGIATNGKATMINPIISAFSTVAFMLCIFGFVGMWLLIAGAKNLKMENSDLAKRQINTAFIMLLVIYGFYELLLRVPYLL